MSAISHQRARQLIELAVKGEGAESAQLEAHLQNCSACRAYQKELQGLEQEIQNVLHLGLDRFSAPDLVPRFSSRAEIRLPGSFHWTGALALGLLLLGLLVVLTRLLPRPDLLLSSLPTATLAHTVSPSASSLPSPTYGPSPMPGRPTPAVLQIQGQPLAVYGRTWKEHSDLFLLDSNSRRYNLTNDPAEDVFPVWSPDGSQIAFLSDRTGQLELYRMRFDGSDLQQLTHTSQDQGWFGPPVWSPDGKELLLVHVSGVTERSPQGITFKAVQLYRVEADGGSLAQVTTDMRPGLIGEVSWSPDGSWIAFTRSTDSGGEELRIIRPDGSDLKELTETASRIGGLTWSPDSNHIALLTQGPWIVRSNSYVLAEDGKIELQVQGLDQDRPSTLLEINPASSKIHSLFWGKDGKRLFFLTSPVQTECWKLAAVQLDGGGQVTYPTCLAPLRGKPVFSADEKLLFLAPVAGDGFDFGVFRLDPNLPVVTPQQLAVVRLVEHQAIELRPELRLSGLPVQTPMVITPPPPSNSTAGVLVPPSQESCLQMKNELSAQVKLPIRLAPSALLEPEVFDEDLPNDRGSACQLSYQGPMPFSSLQQVYTQVESLILASGYHPKSSLTSFRHWQARYVQGELHLVFDIEWQPLDRSACPDQDSPSDCPLPEEQKELRLNLYLARDPLTAEFEAFLEDWISEWKSGEVAALSALTPDLRTQIQDLKGLNTAFGLKNSDPKLSFNFEIRTASQALDRFDLHLTLERSSGRGVIWASERIVTLLKQGQDWKIQDIRSLDD